MVFRRSEKGQNDFPMVGTTNIRTHDRECSHGAAQGLKCSEPLELARVSRRSLYVCSVLRSDRLVPDTT